MDLTPWLVMTLGGTGDSTQSPQAKCQPVYLCLRVSVSPYVKANYIFAYNISLRGRTRQAKREKPYEICFHSFLGHFSLPLFLTFLTLSIDLDIGNIIRPLCDLVRDSCCMRMIDRIDR